MIIDTNVLCKAIGERLATETMWWEKSTPADMARRAIERLQAETVPFTDAITLVEGLAKSLGAEVAK